MEAPKITLKLNEEQEKAAYCEKNAVIAAGAGSGKTMVLASRFAWLVTEKGFRAREILTLTFTNKAAAQMYRRIHLLLSEIARNEPGEKGELAARALDEFAQARIQTLDSYCATLVKQAANRYGIRPDYSTDEERCWQLAVDEALPFLIANRNHIAIRRLYRGKSPVSIAHDVFAGALFYYTHINEIPDPRRDFRAQCTVICREWDRQCAALQEKLRDLEKEYSENNRCHPDLGPLLEFYGSGKLIFPLAGDLEEYFDAVAAMPHESVIERSEAHPLAGRVAAVLDFIASVKFLNLQKGSPRNNPAKDLIRELRDLYGEFSSIALFCIQAGFIFSMLSLLAVLQQRYLSKKRMEGILTFNDAARLARTILLEQRDIREAEKESFRAIMIDEFQDNNSLQKDLLFLLAEKMSVHNSYKVPPAKDLEGGKLFFVGDEKQSIYKFRGADVSVFRKLKDELGAEDVPLKINYRSEPLLIGAFNAIFGGSSFDPAGNSALAEYHAVFAHPDKNSPLPLYEASYSPLKAFKSGEGKLTLCILDKKEIAGFAEGEALSDVEIEARFIAGKINDLLNERDDNGAAKYAPDDIAILFRSRTHQHLFEKHLMLFNTPYACEDLNGFFFGGPVNDLMSVLTLAAYPTNKIAYAQMLRSPFAGLSVQALAICIAALDQSASISPTFDPHADDPAAGETRSPCVPFDDAPLPLLSGSDLCGYLHGQEIYRSILAKARNGSICSLLNDLWYGEGYRHETGWNPKTSPYRELFDYLFHLAATADEDNQTLAAFTDSIHALSESGERLSDLDIPLERSGAVHLLTIHKSKGLEFPVVFLCGCDRKGMNDFSGFFYETEETGLTMNPPLSPACERIGDVRGNFFWERAQADEGGKRTAELRRLLYVGMTRAEKELYLSGCLDIGSADAEEQGEMEFPLLVKQYIDMKLEKAADRISLSGDSILDGNTFFGLCLPAFGAHIPGGMTDALSPSGIESPFFCIEKIPVYTEQDLRKAEQKGQGFPNDQTGLDLFFEKAAPFYEGKKILEAPELPINRFRPTSLPLQLLTDSLSSAESVPPAESAFLADNEYSGEGAADVFASVDKMLERCRKKPGEDGEKFDSASFGTVAHLCVEALLSGGEAAIPPNLACFLSPADAEAFLEAGKELAQRFVRSPFGIKTGNSLERYTEFPFRTLMYGPQGNEIFINGTIDLVFEEADAVVVVDFKTDSQELPEKHLAQMAAYYRAVSDLFASQKGKRCAVWLYYLRTGHAYDLSAQAKELLPKKEN